MEASESRFFLFSELLRCIRTVIPGSYLSEDILCFVRYMIDITGIPDKFRKHCMNLVDMNMAISGTIYIIFDIIFD